MDRIIITEQDLSTNNITEEQIVDVVFIPGFASGENATDPVAAYVPTFCSSIADFEAHFGTIPAKFKDDQMYPKYVAGDTKTKTPAVDGFMPDAIPTPLVGDNPGEEGTLWFSSGMYDPSYIYAKEILYSGLPIMYYRMNESQNQGDENYDVTVEQVYKIFKTKLFNADGKITNDSEIELLDKGEYQFKYLTSGAYPVFEYCVNDRPSAISEAMCKMATKRGDCVAFIDHTDNHERPLQSTVDGVMSVYTAVNKYAIPEDYDTYGTMITPWCSFKVNGLYPTAKTYTNEIELPGSFAYFKCLTQMLNSDSDWLAVAGVTRGLVPNFRSLCTTIPLTNRIADSYQSEPNSTGRGVSINAITNVKPYGYCIWGNRTLRNQEESRVGFALNFLNIRNLVSDVKKQAYVAAKSLMFEQNNEVLWLNFKSLLMPLLDQMVSGEGLSSYKVIKNVTQDKTRLSATIRLYPVYAIESFEIMITLEDEEVTVQ